MAALSPVPEPPASPADLFEFLDRLDIPYEVHSHPPLYTVEDSRQLRGDIPGAHCKSLFLKDRKGMSFLLVCLEHRRIDMKRLADQAGGARLSFGKPEALYDRLGVHPGAVTPFALINDRRHQRVRLLLDRQMLAFDRLNYHPLHNEATVTISRQGLFRFVEACGHRPVTVELDDSQPGSVAA